MRKDTDVVLAIVVNSILIGTVGLHRINKPDRTASLGISIGDKRYWRKGYGTRVIKLILDYGFNTLNLRKVCLSVISFNKRAIGCYNKCGFKTEGVRKQQIFRNGKYYDEVLMAIFAHKC